jgi:hypothetical protein
VCRTTQVHPDRSPLRRCWTCQPSPLRT